MKDFIVRCRQAAGMLAVLAMAGWATPAQAAPPFVINPTFDDASFTAAGFCPTAVHGAFNFAALQFENTFSNPIHVNITVKAGTTGLGASNTNLFGTVSYSCTRAVLEQDYILHPDPTKKAAGKSLGTTDPTKGGQFVFATAEAKALGVLTDNTCTTDGIFTFSSAQPWAFCTTDTPVPGKFDFVGVSEHEISEIMGRIPILGNCLGAGRGPLFDPNDLFRYTAPCVHSLSPGATNVSFSVDGGNTDLVTFNSCKSGDVDDYNGAVATDPFNAFTATNQAHALSTVDIQNLDVLGFDLTAQQGAPEIAPASGLVPVVFVLGCLCVVDSRVRKKTVRG